MGDQEPSRGAEADLKCEPVRSRWTPKPEQILILESIFNSGMVNPPKEETVRIRRMLEKFGAVGDANVFYWFQNRRSRSRRRQRQIQAALGAAGEQSLARPGGGGGVIQYENTALIAPNPAVSYPVPGSSSSFGNDGAGSDSYFSIAGRPGPAGTQYLQQNSYLGPPDASNLHFQSGAGMVTVFINGVATEVGRGAVDMKAMFGEDYALVHSSGVAVEVNEHGFLVQALQHGESYFLVPRHC